MEIIPLELVHKIVEFVHHHLEDQVRFPVFPQGQHRSMRGSQPVKFSSYATVSRPWKEAVETATFSSLRIDSDEIDRFRALVTGSRRNNLTKLSFKVQLPTYSEEACTRVESDEEKLLNNGCFTRAMYDLFSILKAWEDDGV